jgi:hypothetical protein
MKTVIKKKLDEKSKKYWITFINKEFEKSKDGKNVFVDIKLILNSKLVKKSKDGKNEYIDMTEDKIGANVLRTQFKENEENKK